MKICGFRFCVVLCFITTCTFTLTNAIDEDVISGTFNTKGSTIIPQTENTTDVYSKSLISCAGMCLSNPQCCVASYSKVTSTCRIDNSERCCDENEFHDGWTYLQRNSYLTMTCRGCISFNNSLYLISEEHLDWSKAKENCECRGSELAKLETFEENEFIKREVKTRNTGVSGYWIGGYDFYNDNVMEWIGQPDQSMSFSDFQPDEPDAPNDQLCMVLWRDYDFRWGDADCHVQLSYICEFMQH